MRLGTRILLLTLFITVGSSLIVTWIVTLQVTRYESQRANDLISLAIQRYERHLGTNYQQVNQTVHAMLEEPTPRSLLQAADDPSGSSARAQLREEVFGRTVQSQLLDSSGESAAFHVLVNLAGEVVMVSASDASLVPGVTQQAVHWHAQDVINLTPHATTFYVAVGERLFLVMDFALHEQLDELPTHAYFVGFPIDDEWVRKGLLSDMLATGSTIVPLEAAFVLDEKVVASGSSDPSQVFPFRVSPPLLMAGHPANASGTSSAGAVLIDLNGGRFIGQMLDLGEIASSGRFIIVSSLDQALLPLHRLQRLILLTTAIACVVALLVCRLIAGMISKPIRELADATRRVAAGDFDFPVQIRRRDELGALAGSFNAMARGLKDREVLQQQHIKSERDLAVARQIQMDVLPKDLPPCPGYELAVRSEPAEQTGGDIYDLVMPSPGGPLFVLLADATGHGIGAALSVTQVRSMLRIGLRLGASMEDLLAQINQQLAADLGASRFVTAFLGVLDPNVHQMLYHSAGQGPLLHFHAKDRRAQWLNTTGLPLGVSADVESDEPVRLSLEPGDLLVLLTDGYYEHQNSHRELFGIERVVELVKRMHDHGAAGILEELDKEIDQFAPGISALDDMTAVLIRRLPQAKDSGG